MPQPVDLAPTNDAGTTEGSTPTRAIRRRLLIGGLVLFALAWAIAIVYSVTAGGRSPERLDGASARTVERACRDAQRTLAALPQVGENPTVADRATRVEHEDEILAGMVARLQRLHPAGESPATALTAWLGDWQRLIIAREHYVKDLRSRGDNARFVEPATRGVEPIAGKMNNWVLEQGTRTNTCNTDALQVEVVEGPRSYGSGHLS